MYYDNGVAGEMLSASSLFSLQKGRRRGVKMSGQ